MANPVDDAGNVRVDHVWGNLPMQPDDARGANTLDPALDNHIIATTGWNGFPGYAPGEAVFQDLVPNVTAPNVVGVLQATAEAAIEAAELTVGDVTTADNAAGATSENDGKVKTQTPAAGTVVNEGTEVDLVVFDYVAPGITLLAGTAWTGNSVLDSYYSTAFNKGAIAINYAQPSYLSAIPSGSSWSITVTDGVTTAVNAYTVTAGQSTGPSGETTGALNPSSALSSEFTSGFTDPFYYVDSIVVNTDNTLVVTISTP